MAQRLSYEESCRALQRQEIIEAGDVPPLPARSPRYDDVAPLGVNFFRTLLSDEIIEGLTLPRTFMCRSEFSNVSFRNTDLSESTFNWNDFIDVDFSFADLARCDLRGCVFRGVRFIQTSLRDADLLHCTFTGCDFNNADLSGVKLTRKVATSLGLSVEQQHNIDAQSDDGEEPDGG